MRSVFFAIRFRPAARLADRRYKGYFYAADKFSASPYDRSDHVMRIRFIILPAVVVLCAGGAAYFFNSGMHRQYAYHLRKLTLKAYSGINGFIHENGALSGPEKSRTKNRPDHSPIENNILDRLKLLEIADSAVSFHTLSKDTAIEIRAAVPRGKPVEWIIWHLSSAVAGTSYQVEDCTCPPGDRGCTIRFTSSASGQPAIILTVSWASRYFSKTARMAILIKDFGFAADQKTIDYLSFPEPLTVALLPSRKLASWTAQISNEYKKEIIVLQPMEPCYNPRSRESRRPSCIMIHYPEERLRSIIADAAGVVPNFAGFINSGGTRVLEDSRVTNILFTEIKKRHGYFIEDGTTRKSVAAIVARKISLPFATIGCSVDSAMHPDGIQDLIRRCAIEAQKRGCIIVSSKATTAFIRALKNELPVLRQNGIRLSYISEILTPDKENKR